MSSFREGPGKPVFHFFLKIEVNLYTVKCTGLKCTGP